MASRRPCGFHKIFEIVTLCLIFGRAGGTVPDPGSAADDCENFRPVIPHFIDGAVTARPGSHARVHEVRSQSRHRWLGVRLICVLVRWRNSYGEFHQLAGKFDQLTGNDKWRKEPESKYVMVAFAFLSPVAAPPVSVPGGRE